MSGAAEATELLRTAAMAEYKTLKDRVAETAKAVIKLREQLDIVLLMAAVDDLSLAAEALAAAAKAVHESADAALTQTMRDTGCTGFATPYHTTSLREGTPSVEILDTAAVPAVFMTTPSPQPDKRAIAKALKANGAVNWARLNPGKPGLTRRHIP
jgi:Siphovirus Gp157